MKIDQNLQISAEFECKNVRSLNCRQILQRHLESTHSKGNSNLRKKSASFATKLYHNFSGYDLIVNLLSGKILTWSMKKVI